MLVFTLTENYALVGNMWVVRETLKEGENYIGISNPLLVEQLKRRVLALCEAVSHNSDLFKAMEEIEKALEITKKMGEEYQFLYCHNQLIQAVIL